ncbi:MAG: TolC family protein [Planctomycetes bacterium]|nr:TolC family protein [Planctomycetota bacterium]
MRGSAAPGEQQGIFVDQTIVRGGKLKLNREKYSQEIIQAELQAAAQQYHVVNGVRVRFYQLLAMNRLLEVRTQLVKNAEDAVKTTEELVNVGAANRPDFLQAKIETRQERVALENSRTLLIAAWKQLGAYVGDPKLLAGGLQGSLEEGTALPDQEASLAHLLEASPELQIAQVEVTRNQLGLKREKVEPIPNVQFRVATGYNFESKTQTTTVNVGVKLPLFDKNQGNIMIAESQLHRSMLESQRVELSLRQRFARAYARYRTALTAVENYRKFNVPEAREAYELYLDSFKKRRAAYPQVLIALRSYFQISVEYVEALEQLRRAEVTIRGLLLVDGLDEPPGLPSEGPVRRREGEPDLPDPIGRDSRPLDNRIGNRPRD